MKQVNLFIVGGQKCGTTALASFLRQHPDVCLVDGKEAHVFDMLEPGERTQENLHSAYSPLLSHYNGEKYICDATPIYSYWQDIHESLAQHSPKAKVIFMLRDPVERAVSQYQMEFSRGNEEEGIVSAFLKESARLKRDAGNRALDSSWRLHSYLDRGKFFEQYMNLLKFFPAEQILVLHNNELRNQHQATLKRVYDFLEISDFHIPQKDVFSGKYKAEGVSLKLAKLYAALKLKRDRAFVKQYEPS